MRRGWLHIACAFLVGFVALCVMAEPAFAQATSNVAASNPQAGAMLSSGGIKIEMTPGEDAGNLVPGLKLALLMMVLSLLPAALVSVTSFTRIVIVLGFVRQALGTQSLPPNQVLIGLSLFLCLFTMGPTMSQVYDQAVQPYMNEELNDLQAVEAAVVPMRQFMAKHTRPEELKLFVSMTQQSKPQSFDDVGTLVLVPAFMLSELRTAFIMGALIYIPFIIIDIVVASILMSMGMMMVPPAMISLPVKLLLFVLADGWNLVVASLARSIMAG